MRTAKGFDYHVPPNVLDHMGALLPLAAPLLSENRLERLHHTIARRSRQVICVFENTHHTHNISAVLRSTDAMGFQDVVFIYDQPNMVFKQRDTVERGSAKWLTCKRVTHFDSLAAALKCSQDENEILVLCVTLPTFARTGDSLDRALPGFGCHEVTSSEFRKFVSQRRIILVFGNEKYGIDARWLPLAQGFIFVPMNGFVESLNLSVCAGILLQSLRQWCDAPGHTQNLSPAESQLLLESFLARSVDLLPRMIQMQHTHLEPYLRFCQKSDYFLNPVS